MSECYCSENTLLSLFTTLGNRRDSPSPASPAPRSGCNEPHQCKIPLYFWDHSSIVRIVTALNPPCLHSGIGYYCIAREDMNDTNPSTILYICSPSNPQHPRAPSRRLLPVSPSALPRLRHPFDRPFDRPSNSDKTHFSTLLWRLFIMNR